MGRTLFITLGCSFVEIVAPQHSSSYHPLLFWRIAFHGVSKSCFKLTIGQAESILDPRALSLTVRPWARVREIAEGPISISNAVLSGEVFKLKTSVFVKR
jgi:hypothetical protein